MAVELIDGSLIFNSHTLELSQRLTAAQHAGSLVTPRLEALTTYPHYPANQSYAKALLKEAVEIDPRFDPQDPNSIFGLKSFECERDLLRYVQEHTDNPGLSFLILRPLKDENTAQAIGLFSSLNKLQDVDGQAGAEGQPTLHTPATVKSCLTLLDYANRENGGIAGLSRVAVIGDGPAVGRKATAELRKRGVDVTVITHNKNQDLLKNLGQFDAVIGAAGGPRSTEIVNPFYLWRPSQDTRPPLIFIDAGYAVAEGETKPQGNLDRLLRSETFRATARLSARVAVLGTVGAGARTEIFENAFCAADLKPGTPMITPRQPEPVHT